MSNTRNCEVREVLLSMSLRSKNAMQCIMGKCATFPENKNNIMAALKYSRSFRYVTATNGYLWVDM